VALLKGKKCVILAGGRGTRIAEESNYKPKPMVEIGGRPILWHIMKSYSYYGVNEFIICAGYKGYLIKEYFANYFLHMADITFHMSENRLEVHEKHAEPWKVTVVDTGDDTQTGGRIARIRRYVEGSGSFFMTYGDGLSNVNIKELYTHHIEQKTIATVTTVCPPGRFGQVDIDGHKINGFTEKPEGDGYWINGGFFVLDTKIFQYIEDDKTVLEREPLEKLASEGELTAWKHSDFWHPMDTIRDQLVLEDLWNSGKAPWKQW
jgi:glucose-1-phosphate cytidylyltransferase